MDAATTTAATPPSGAHALLTRASLAEGISYLRRSDPRLRAWIDRIGVVGLRRHRHRFGALAKAIVSQQLAARAAETIHRRFLAHFAPLRSPDPARLLALGDDELRSCGISGRKIEYLRALAHEFHAGDLSRLRLSRLSDEEVIARLVELPGIGVWTAEMFLIFSLGRLDVFSAGDFALRSGVGRVEGRGIVSPAEAREIARRWSPYRSVASLYLWKIAHWK